MAKPTEDDLRVAAEIVQAHKGYDGFCVNLDELRSTITSAIAAEREKAAKAAESAKLPNHFQWGRDAMESFNFGKERAALAIRAGDKPE